MKMATLIIARLSSAIGKKKKASHDKTKSIAIKQTFT